MIPFVEFMRQALYAPGLGYYSTGRCQFGAEGDFITAPEISPLFSHCVARQCYQILSHLKGGVILELGAGSGLMAAEILKELARLNCLPSHYLILEVSAELQQRQRLTLQTKAGEFWEQVSWLNGLPSQPFQGVILANEVLDAMPVHRFRLEKEDVSEFQVGHDGNQWVWHLTSTACQALRVTVEAWRSSLAVGYVSEVNLMTAGWLQALADLLVSGLILLIDYGFPNKEYYHPQRHQGTLMCHYRHYAHADPLILVGLQDITAHVDFTAIAAAALAADLQVAGYTTQANFLLACGLLELLSSYNSKEFKTYLQLAQSVKTLLLPSEMGELFKVMALTRHINIPLLGFAKDEREKL